MTEGDFYLCMDCGNYKLFEQGVDEIRYAVVTNLIDGKGNHIEKVDDYIDEDKKGDAHDPECHICHADGVETFSSEIKRMKTRWKHTNKQGRWYFEELLEKSRSPQLLKKMTMEGI